MTARPTDGCRIAAQTNPALAEELYLSILTRKPTDAEVADVRDFLAKWPKEKKAQGVSELAWALLASAEFRFNH